MGNARIEHWKHLRWTIGKVGWLTGVALLCANPARAQNVIAWGDNSRGQTTVPVSATNVIAVAGGGYHSLALRSDGAVLAWGNNTYGQTTVPKAATNVVAIAAGFYHSLALRTDGSVLAWGYDTYGQATVPAGATNVVAIAAGYYHNLALRADGTVLAWGKGKTDTGAGPTNVPPAATNIIAIAAGPTHSLALRQDGAVLVWGGSDAFSPSWYGAMPRSVKDVVALAGGSFQNLALMAGGKVTFWGGKGIRGKELMVPAWATNVVSIAAATNYNLALSADGKVLAWGLGAVANVPASATNAIAVAAGYLHGLAVTSAEAPPQILGPVGVGYRTDIGAGSPLPLYVRAVGDYPLHYQWLADGLPIPDTDSPLPQVPARLGTDRVSYQVVVSNAFGCVTSAVARVRVQTVNAWGQNGVGQCQVPEAVTNACALAAGAFHALALNSNGTVIAWGKNQDGQVSVPPTATNVVAIAAGSDHSLALRSDGSVMGWGRNWDGQTDVPATATNVVAVAAGWAHSLALRQDGTVVAWGNNDYGQTNVSLLAAEVTAIAAGYFHSMALRADGTVVTWGWEVPVPVAATNVVAIAAGWEHCLALRADGSVVAWGDNSYGQSAVPAPATNLVAIVAGYYHNLALRADGQVIAWGKGAFGVTQVPLGGNFLSVAAGEDYSLALVGSGPPQFMRQPRSALAHVGQRVALLPEVAGACPMTFQWFHDGQIVPEATNRFLVLSHVQVTDAGSYQLEVRNAAGQGTSQAVSLNVEATPFIASGLLPQSVVVGGTMCLEAPVSGAEPMSYQWRLNGTNLVDGGGISGATSRILCLSAADYGWSGNFSLVASNAYGCFTGLVAQVSVTPIIGWGDNSCDQISTPAGITDVVSVAGGGTHSLALRANGTIVGWGDNAYGQSQVPPGLSNVVAVAGGRSHSLALGSDGSVVAWGNNDLGQTNVPSAATNVVRIAAGDGHSMALRADGTVVVWGAPFLTSVPVSATNVVAIAAGGSSCVVLRADGTVVCWGALGAAPASATNVVAIAAGLAHALALRADGVILAWGANFYGQTFVPADAVPAVGIAAGRYHSLALLADGSVVGWGGDDSNQARVPASVAKIRALSAGGAHNLALVGPRPAFPTYARTAFLGQSTLLSAGAPSGAWAGYQWQFNGVDLPAATNAALVLPSVHWTNAGIYRVVVSSALGVVAGPPMELMVLRTPLVFDSAQCRPDPTTGQFRLRLAGASGVGSVIVYASDNLVTWNPIYTNAPTIGRVDYLDLPSGSGTARFYRAVESSAEKY